MTESDSPEREPTELAAPEHELAAPEHELAARLDAERPLPRPDFRGALGRHLSARDPGYGPRPERLRAIVATYAAGGIALAAVGALVSLGVL